MTEFQEMAACFSINCRGARSSSECIVLNVSKTFFFLQTIQIMTGVVVFLFGITTAFYATTISSFTGIMFWGAIIVR